MGNNKTGPGKKSRTVSSVYNYKPKKLFCCRKTSGCSPPPPRVNQRRAADLICLGSYIDTPQKRGIRAAILSTSILATLWIHRDTPVITRGVPQPNPAPINTFVPGFLSDLRVTTSAAVTGRGKEISERKRERETDRETRMKKGRRERSRGWRRCRSNDGSTKEGWKNDPSFTSETRI